MKNSRLKLEFNQLISFPLIRGRFILYPTNGISIYHLVEASNELSKVKNDPGRYAVVIDDHIGSRVTHGTLARYETAQYFQGMFGFEITSINNSSTLLSAEGRIKYRIDDDITNAYKLLIKGIYYKYLRMKGSKPSKNFVANSFDMFKRFYFEKETGIDFTLPLQLESEYERLHQVRLFLSDKYNIKK